MNSISKLPKKRQHQFFDSCEMCSYALRVRIGIDLALFVCVLHCNTDTNSAGSIPMWPLRLCVIKVIKSPPYDPFLSRLSHIWAAMTSDWFLRRDDVRFLRDFWWSWFTFLPDRLPVRFGTEEEIESADIGRKRVSLKVFNSLVWLLVNGHLTFLSSLTP